MLTKFAFTILLFTQCSTAEDESHLQPSNKINQGSLTGKYMESRNGRQFSAYLGIPYAEPPIGNLRFKAPIPGAPWKGNLKATEHGAMCPQEDPILKLPYMGDENCLFLNVYTPQLTTSDSRSFAVMIFIHGGGFVCGTGNSYGPDYLLDEDIVLVTFNYRLGPLGFMSTGDEILPGNNGLKDQSLALKWVNQNIRAFGGDPKRITIFGESAGAASVHFHMFSPLSRGLFSAAISQSGTVFSTWALTDKKFVVGNTKKLAQYVGCSTDNHYDMIECLRSADEMKLVESRRIFYEWDIEPLMVFTAVVEDDTEGSFLPDSPLNILKSGKYANVPWITGVNSAEGAFRVAGIHKDKKLLRELDEDFNRIMAITFISKDPQFEHIAKRIRKFYFGNKQIGENTILNAVDLYSDIIIIPATHLSVELHLKYSKQPVYYYLFSHSIQHSFAELIGVPSFRYGAGHLDEALLQFPVGLMLRAMDQEDLRYSRLLISMWTNFAAYGNPTPETGSLITSKWEPVTTTALEYYHIGGGVHTSSNLYSERIQFWKQINKEMKLSMRDEL
uniref:Carboxylic ester hydrolase n=1 Tax=Photinus pyralis TaxID=7054 RepID=A0A1Y1L4R3_PHOPY